MEIATPFVIGLGEAIYSLRQVVKFSIGLAKECAPRRKGGECEAGSSLRDLQ
jgi:hypothetical protein